MFHYHSPVHEAIIAHAVRVASTADLHVLNEAEVADLVEHQLLVILMGSLVPVWHDAADIVWLLWGEDGVTGDRAAAVLKMSHLE